MGKDELVDSAEIRKVLKFVGVEKVYVVDEDLNNQLLLGFYAGKQYLILIAKGRYAWYSKIVPAEIVLEPYWKCNYIIYIPEGLYAFARNISELSTKISKILERYQRYKT